MSIPKKLNHNFQSVKFIDVDYRRTSNCEQYYCDDICRCSRIRDCELSIAYNDFLSYIYDIYFDNSIQTTRNNVLNNILSDITKEIDIYTIDRITRIFRLWDKSNWDIIIDKGYYGEEIGGVYINNVSRIESSIDKALSIDNLTNRIQYLIELEYGYLLPELKNCKFEVIEINKSDIIFGSHSQLENVKLEKLDHYSDMNYSNIRGIVISKCDKWRLIDGYHRCFETKLEKIKVINSIKITEL
jgi:hypothetical protein